jgi:hypothetical protein
MDYQLPETSWKKTRGTDPARGLEYYSYKSLNSIF